LTFFFISELKYKTDCRRNKWEGNGRKAKSGASLRKEGVPGKKLGSRKRKRKYLEKSIIQKAKSRGDARGSREKKKKKKKS